MKEDESSVIDELPVIAESARRHKVPDAVILHAFRNPIRSEEVDERLTMLIGADHAANLYEIGVVDSDDGPVIVHAMAARTRYLG